MHFQTNSNGNRPSNGRVPEYAESLRGNEDSIIDPNGSHGLSFDFPKRPAYGFKGDNVLLWANYTEICLKSDTVLYRYAISVDPEAQGKKAAQVIKLYLDNSHFDDFRQDIVTDFRSTILSIQNLPTIGPVTITYRAEDEDEPRKHAKIYTIKLSRINPLPVEDLNKYLVSKSPSAVYSYKDEMVQALNILINHYSKTNSNSVTVGTRKVFDRNSASSCDLGGGLKAMRGFYASVRLATSRPLINVNITHAVFYKEGPLLTLANEYMLGGKSLENLHKYLNRLRVLVTHLKPNNKEGKRVSRVKTIVGLATRSDGANLDPNRQPIVPKSGASSKDVKFWWSKKGEERYISVYDYFLQEHKKTLNQPNLPVVNIGTLENPTYLPLETCIVLPNQVARTKLDRDQVDTMIQFSVQERLPATNARDIEVDGFRSVGLSSNNTSLVRSPFSTSPSLITVPGRILATPTVIYYSGRELEVSDGKWDLRSVKFSKSGSKKDWAFVVINTTDAKLKSDDIKKFKTEFKKELVNNGVAHDTPKILKKEILNVAALKDIQGISEDIFKDAAKKNIFLVVFILPLKITPDQYNYIKKLGDIKYGIATICMDGRHKPTPQYLANITMKFNLKMGGNNQFVNLKETSLNFDETMIVGIDVTHPATGSSTEAPSIAGMVASVDASLGQWPAVIRRQVKRGKEMVSELDKMLSSCLKRWNTRHGDYPKNILVYRDGVSEGQFKKVLEEELPLLRKACRELYPASQPKKGLPRISVIIVVKRHHTRFYLTEKNRTQDDKKDDKRENLNPQPGTVVDRGVTEARNWDFFLQAHYAIQGTARPIHYFVVHDEIFREMEARAAANNLENLTHRLSYIYGRATRAVSVCTPAYYADLVCDRARCYPDTTDIHKNLETCMFYI
ncbi:Piwi-domain-containing protein [Hypoxylon sp. EC38]|nr:Piwi-domain-containing protein [Hypoxylon sp. EC38]